MARPNVSAVADDLGKLVLRVSLAVLMLPHGIHKVLHPIVTVHEMAPSLAARDLPSFVAYGVFVGEVLVPLLLVIGLLTRASGLAMATNMLFALYLKHSADVTAFNPASGGFKLELQYLYLFGALAVTLVGPGRIALDHMFRRRVISNPGSVRTPTPVTLAK